MTTKRSSGWASTRTGAWTKRAWSSTSCNAMPKSASLFSCRTAGTGFLWNNPAIGRVELGLTATRWVSDSARQIDYWVTAGSPAQIMARYADVTGHVPVLPSWAAGFWQSKLRYRTQEELLEVAREYHRRGLPLSVIVADFFHWTQLGDWRFEPSEWPDPQAMVDELSAMGVRLTVSVWPSVSVMSSNYQTMFDAGYFIATERGALHHADWPDRHASARLPVAFYDATNPEAREYVWDQLRANYYKYGIKLFWLDACEPELKPGHVENLRLAAGPGREVLNRYPADHAAHHLRRHAGRRRTRRRKPWSARRGRGASNGAPFCGLAISRPRSSPWLPRSGPASTWGCRVSHGGRPTSEASTEVTRATRSTGSLLSAGSSTGCGAPCSGSTGTVCLAARFLKPCPAGPTRSGPTGRRSTPSWPTSCALRERIKPYVLEQMASAAEHGTPPMRPLWFDFPDDATAWDVEDQYLFGPSVLVAPVTSFGGAVSQRVPLPTGRRGPTRTATRCTVAVSGPRVAAPLERIPIFLRDGAVGLPSLYPPPTGAPSG